MKYVCLLLILGISFVHAASSVYAVEDDDATSRAGIRFVDRRDPVDESAGADKENVSAEKPERNFPKTNEQPASYLMVIGLIIVSCVIGLTMYKKIGFNKEFRK